MSGFLLSQRSPYPFLCKKKKIPKLSNLQPPQFFPFLINQPCGQDVMEMPPLDWTSWFSAALPPKVKGWAVRARGLLARYFQYGDLRVSGFLNGGSGLQKRVFQGHKVKPAMFLRFGLVWHYFCPLLTIGVTEKHSSLIQGMGPYTPPLDGRYIYVRICSHLESPAISLAVATWHNVTAVLKIMLKKGERQGGMFMLLK